MDASSVQNAFPANRGMVEKMIVDLSHVFRDGMLMTCLYLSPEDYSNRPPDCEPGPSRLYEVFERVSP